MFSFLDDFSSPLHELAEEKNKSGNLESLLSGELDNIFGSELNQFTSAIGEIKSTKKELGPESISIQAATESLANEILKDMKISNKATGNLLVSAGLSKTSHTNLAGIAKKPVEDFRYTDFPLEAYAEKVMNVSLGSINSGSLYSKNSIRLQTGHLWKSKRRFSSLMKNYLLPRRQ